MEACVRCGDTGRSRSGRRCAAWAGILVALLATIALAAGSRAAEPLPGGGDLNILLVGVDARPGESIDGGVRADALMVLHLDRTTGTCGLLSIPRDTRVELPGYGATKINHALMLGGVSFQREAVAGLLGLAIDRHVLVDFAGFAAAIDAVGGVRIAIGESFTAGGVTFAPGERVLTGDEALSFVRYRGGPDGDFGRIERQQQVILALARGLASPDPVRLLEKLLPAVRGHLRTDLTPAELTVLAARYRPTCTADTVRRDRLGGETATFDDPVVGRPLSYVVVAADEIRRKVAALLADPSEAAVPRRAA